MVKLRLKEDDGKEGQYKLIETSYTTGELLLHFWHWQANPWWQRGGGAARECLQVLETMQTYQTNICRLQPL